jgi:uncharacterized membrane protein YkgB
MEAKMKTYSILSKIGISLCIVGILVVVMNWFTGFINSKMTAGASVICLSSLIIALSAIINIDNLKKNK